MAGVYGMNFDHMPELAWRYGYAGSAAADGGGRAHPVPAVPPLRLALTPVRAPGRPHGAPARAGPKLATMLWQRYVAIGDSTTEGLDDPDGNGGYRGWADRFALAVARAQGRLEYANLAIRGRTTARIRAEQLPVALGLAPDLATVVAGMNDVLRPSFDADQVAEDVGAMQRALVGRAPPCSPSPCPTRRR